VTRVLVVEDEASYSEALSYMLRKEGFEVAVAEDGTDALKEFDRNGADIVLLDLMLPGLSGTEVCRQIRATSSVPVIMVTAKDDEVDKVVGLELGADDYVTKPYSPPGSVPCSGEAPSPTRPRPRSRPGRSGWTWSATS
jgi:two-component system response regulator RegX3